MTSPKESALLPASHLALISLSSILLLGINLLVFGMHRYNQRKSMEFTQMQLLLQKESATAEYYKLLLDKSENRGILLHDIKKHLQSIALLNEKEEHEKISLYIEQLLQFPALKEGGKLCDNELLNAILWRYQEQCRQKNLAFHTDFRSGSLEFFTDSDITSLFCNLLDNALEAAAGIPHAFVEISAGKRESSSLIVITIVNSCKSSPFDRKGKLLSGRKPDKALHGFGMKSIQKTLDKYNGDMHLYYHEAAAAFHTIIVLNPPKTP